MSKHWTKVQRFSRRVVGEKKIDVNHEIEREKCMHTSVKIEACLNSRPLILESSDPNDPGALTPGHFIIGGPIAAVPNPDITNVPINRLKYWQLVSQKMQELWNR